MNYEFQFEICLILVYLEEDWSVHNTKAGTVAESSGWRAGRFN